MEQGKLDLRTGLTIYPERDNNFTDFSKNLLKGFYLTQNETIQEGLARASFAWSNKDRNLAQRIYDYASKGWFMFASPVLSNAPAYDPIKGDFVKSKGLPISCYLSFTEDSVQGLIDHSSEVRWLSVLGGGVGGHWREVRSVSDKSPGPIPFLHTIDADMEAYKQGKSRRGSYAAYIDCDHPDIIEFLNIRVPTGDTSRKCHSAGFHNAINITDKFMEAVEADTSWDLIDPASKEVKETVSARDLWNQILNVRYRTGEPYLYFIDEANRKLPQAQKDKGLKSNGSNLCLTGDTEIHTNSFEGIKTITLKHLHDIFRKNSKIEVLSFRKETDSENPNNVEFKRITNCKITGHTKELYHIETETNSIKCTADHKIYTSNAGYKKASELTIEDVLVEWDDTADLEYKEVNPISITKIELEEEIPVYDIGVTHNHNFFANDILVHNCIEITLPTSEDRTAVCCLSSLNVEKYAEWKDTTIVEDLIVMLDNVIQYFIDNAAEPLKKAIYSATQERSIGLGVMGFHYLLQRNMIPFESVEAKELNIEVFKTIQERAIKASLELGSKFGECPDLQTDITLEFEDGNKVNINSSEILKDTNNKEFRVFETCVGMEIDMGAFTSKVKDIEGLHSHSGRRNAHLIAIAPNANSGIILSTSASIEPVNSNAYTHQTRAGSWPVMNPYLEKAIDSKNLSKEEKSSLWNDIISSKGSIQHLDIFTEKEKNVFKTAIEINQLWVVEHAADRQYFICQSQSLNLFFPPKTPREVFSKVHRTAWKKGLKSLYYVRTVTPHRAENIALKVERNKLEDGDSGECIACQG